MSNPPLPTPAGSERSDFERREKPWTPFCEGGSGTCYECVGSCGIEEYEAREADRD